MPASEVFSTVTVSPGRKTVWFTFSFDDHPNRGPMACMARPDGASSVARQLVVEDFAMDRGAPPHPQVFYGGLISNLGTEATGCSILAAYFPELQGDWET
jgi:hypothetical protein